MPRPGEPRIVAPDGAGEGGAEHRSERTRRCVSEERKRQRAPAPRYWTLRMVLASDQCFSRP